MDSVTKSVFILDTKLMLCNSFIAIFQTLGILGLAGLYASCMSETAQQSGFQSLATLLVSSTGLWSEEKKSSNGGDEQSLMKEIKTPKEARSRSG